MLKWPKQWWGGSAKVIGCKGRVEMERRRANEMGMTGTVGMIGL